MGFDEHHRCGALSFLAKSGAEDLAHPGGTLMAHLSRTANLLEAWWAPDPLCLAGLCHAAYGTDGFDVALLGVDSRAQLTALIGSEAEELVYLYASCDRRFSYPGISRGAGRFRDRFTDQVFGLGGERLKTFMELTFANELDIAAQQPGMAEDAWAALVDLFDRCEDLVSPAAWAAYQLTRATRHRHVEA